MLFVLKNILHLPTSKLNTYNDKYIHLEDGDNVSYWMQKLSTNRERLHDAILYTGSIYIGDLKVYLKKTKKTNLPIVGLYHSIKDRLVFHH
jgi:hypothetical protein